MVLEIGDSAYTEFLMNHGEYEYTCDAILIDEVYAESKLDAEEKVIREHSNRKFDWLIVREIVENKYT